jgi:hypothetical protein
MATAPNTTAPTPVSPIAAPPIRAAPAVTGTWLVAAGGLVTEPVPLGVGAAVKDGSTLGEGVSFSSSSESSESSESSLSLPLSMGLQAWPLPGQTTLGGLTGAMVVVVPVGRGAGAVLVAGVGIGAGVSSTGQMVVETAMVSVTTVTSPTPVPDWQGWVGGQEVMVLTVVV